LFAITIVFRLATKEKMLCGAKKQQSCVDKSAGDWRILCE
jgi:hypothetical protein